MLLRALRRRAGPDPGPGRHDRGHREGRGAGQDATSAISCRSSSRTRPIRRSTARPPPRRSGATPTARSTSSWPGVGTGGTITGVGEVLKARKPSVQVDRGRARRVAGAVRRRRRGRTRSRASAPASCPACSTPGLSTRSSASRTTTPSTRPARHGHARKACWSASPPAPRSGPPSQVAKRPENAGKLIVVDHPRLRRALPQHRRCSRTWATERCSRRSARDLRGRPAERDPAARSAVEIGAVLSRACTRIWGHRAQPLAVAARAHAAGPAAAPPFTRGSPASRSIPARSIGPGSSSTTAWGW